MDARTLFGEVFAIQEVNELLGLPDKTPLTTLAVELFNDRFLPTRGDKTWAMQECCESCDLCPYLISAVSGNVAQVLQAASFVRENNSNYL